jgi:hypothetical protein
MFPDKHDGSAAWPLPCRALELVKVFLSPISLVVRERQDKKGDIPK